MADIDRLKRINDELYVQGADIANEIANLSKVSYQLADRFAHVGDMLTEIDKSFAEATGILNKKDLVFLFVATGLLCSKWLIMGQIAPLDFDFKHEPNLDDRDDASDVSDGKDKTKTGEDEGKYRTINQILFGSVPYDAMSMKDKSGNLVIPGTNPEANLKLYGKNHHAYTMGHDPIFGWIFGTANILSRSITLKQPFPITYNVAEEGNKITTMSSLTKELSESIGSIRDNNKRLPTAVMRHGLHLESDKFCHTGLPIPFLSAEKAQELILQGWNSVEFSRAIKKVEKAIGKDVAIVGIQFAISLLINEIIKAIHLLMYSEEKDGELRLYQVRTRKILTVSNCISSSSNILFSAGVAIATKNPIEGAKRLDIGGFIETIHRLVVDTKFINEIKREYIKDNLRTKILDTDFALLYGTEDMSMVNKNYRNGAEDVGGIAAKAFRGVSESADKFSADFGSYNEKQCKINKDLITGKEEHEQRLLAVEHKLPSIDFGLVDLLPSEKRAFLGGIIRSIVLPNNECRQTADLIISRFGVEPLATIDNEQIRLLSQDIQQFCAYYLYLVLRKTGGNADTEASINNVLDKFRISNDEKKQIKSVIDTYSISDIDKLVQIRKGGKQNIVLIGKTEALPASLINSVLGRIMVNDGFHNESNIIPESLETNESPIRFCGVFEVGYDNEKNSQVIDTARKIVSSRSDINRVSNIWYCINTSSHRVEPYELLLLKELLSIFQNVGVIVVFTNCISEKTAKTLADVIESKISSGRIQFVNVLTESFTLDNGQTINPYGTDDLISLTLKDNSEGL